MARTVTPHKIAWYITPHGFGHAVRSLEVIRHLLESDPPPEIVIVSDLPDSLVQQNLGRNPEVRRKRLDIGLVQKDSIRYDLDATRAALERLHDSQRSLIAEEVEFLRDCHVDGVVSDIGFLPFYAASKAEISAMGMGNFTWDWIYAEMTGTDVRWRGLIEWCRAGYALCDLLLRLPMHGDCSSCPNIEDVPMVARKASRKRQETRELLGCGDGRKTYLVSFTELDLSPEALERIGRIEDSVFFYRQPLRLDAANARSADGTDVPYVDIVAAVDAVITKPGYGIVTDCLANGTPVVYSDRGRFPEYEILVREMEARLATVYMSSKELYAGNWGPFLSSVQALPRRAPETPANGAEFCARRILKWLSERKS